MGFYRWEPSKKSIKEFKETMDQVENFCKEKKITIDYIKKYNEICKNDYEEYRKTSFYCSTISKLFTD